jgi:hypothetical protein
MRSYAMKKKFIDVLFCEDWIPTDIWLITVTPWGKQAANGRNRSK